MKLDLGSCCPVFRLKFDLKLQNKAEISMRFEYDLNIKKYLTSKHCKLAQRNASVIARCLALCETRDLSFLVGKKK